VGRVNYPFYLEILLFLGKEIQLGLGPYWASSSRLVALNCSSLSVSSRNLAALARPSFVSRKYLIPLEIKGPKWTFLCSFHHLHTRIKWGTVSSASWQ